MLSFNKYYIICLAWEARCYESGVSHLPYFTNESEAPKVIMKLSKAGIQHQLGIFVPALRLVYTDNYLLQFYPDVCRVNCQHTHSYIR